MIIRVKLINAHSMSVISYNVSVIKIKIKIKKSPELSLLDTDCTWSLNPKYKNESKSIYVNIWHLIQ